MNTQFPVGGPRDPVYQFLRQHGFVMSNWSDKHWHRRDGLSAHIYGTGSRCRIMRGESVIADGPLADAIAKATNALPR